MDDTCPGRPADRLLYPEEEIRQVFGERPPLPSPRGECACGADADTAGTGPDGEPMCARCRYLGPACALCGDTGWTVGGGVDPCRMVCPKCPAGERGDLYVKVDRERGAVAGTLPDATSLPVDRPREYTYAAVDGVGVSGPVAEPIVVESDEDLIKLFGGVHPTTRDAAATYLESARRRADQIDRGRLAQIRMDTDEILKLRAEVERLDVVETYECLCGESEAVGWGHDGKPVCGACLRENRSGIIHPRWPDRAAASAPKQAESSEADAPPPEASAPTPQGIPDQRPLQGLPGPRETVSPDGDGTKPLRSTSSVDRAVLLVVVDGLLLGELDDFELRIERPPGKQPYARVVLEVCAELDGGARLLEQWHEWSAAAPDDLRACPWCRLLFVMDGCHLCTVCMATTTVDGKTKPEGGEG